MLPLCMDCDLARLERGETAEDIKREAAAAEARGKRNDPGPLFVVDATTRGTGKTRLVQATARPAFGQEAAAFSQPEDEDEIRKRITPILFRK